jgi:hypothetical protein
MEKLKKIKMDTHTKKAKQNAQSILLGAGSDSNTSKIILTLINAEQLLVFPRYHTIVRLEFL